MEDDKTPEKGEKIYMAFAYITQFYKEMKKMIRALDKLLGEKGWKSVQSRTTDSMSKILDNPDQWLTRWSFRYYENGECENVRLCLYIIYYYEKIKDIKEPVIVIGRVKFDDENSIDEDFLWPAWKKFWNNNPKPMKKDFREVRLKDGKSCQILIIPLDSIGSKKDLKEKVFNQFKKIM